MTVNQEGANVRSLLLQGNGWVACTTGQTFEPGDLGRTRKWVLAKVATGLISEIDMPSGVVEHVPGKNALGWNKRNPLVAALVASTFATRSHGLVCWRAKSAYQERDGPRWRKEHVPGNMAPGWVEHNLLVAAFVASLFAAGSRAQLIGWPIIPRPPISVISCRGGVCPSSRVGMLRATLDQGRVSPRSAPRASPLGLTN